jgi:hypothetical protein
MDTSPSDISPAEVVRSLWGSRDGGKHATNTQAYLDYYQRQWAYYRSEQGLSIFQNFNDFSSVLQQIKNGASPAEIIAKLKEEHKDKGYARHVFQDSIELAARALTMANMGSDDLSWSEGSLKQFLESQLPDVPSLDCEKTAFPKGFNAWSVQNAGGIAVEFTDNLADHLRLTREDKAVLIFHHVSFLQRQVDRFVLLPGPQRGELLLISVDSTGSLLPPGLAKETLETLSFLFPKSEFSGIMGSGAGRGKWLKATCGAWEEKTGGKVDAQLLHCQALPENARRIKKFNYWGDRLVLLKERYDNKAPGAEGSVLTKTLFTASVQSAWGH